jgi:hypothetical protein
MNDSVDLYEALDKALENRVFHINATVVIRPDGELEGMSGKKDEVRVAYPMLKPENEEALVKRLMKAFPEYDAQAARETIREMREYAQERSQNKESPFDYTEDQIMAIRNIKRQALEEPELLEYFLRESAEAGVGGDILLTSRKDIIDISDLKDARGKAAYNLDTHDIAFSSEGASLMQEELVHYADSKMGISAKFDLQALKRERESLKRISAMLRDTEQAPAMTEDLMRGIPQDGSLTGNTPERTQRNVRNLVEYAKRAYNLENYGFAIEELPEKNQRAEQLAHVYMNITMPDEKDWKQNQALLAKIAPTMAEACDDLHEGVRSEIKRMREGQGPLKDEGFDMGSGYRAQMQQRSAARGNYTGRD